MIVYGLIFSGIVLGVTIVVFGAAYIIVAIENKIRANRNRGHRGL